MSLAGRESGRRSAGQGAAFLVMCTSLVMCMSALPATGCTVDDLDLEGRRCPCIAGWVCDPARDLCVRARSNDASVELDGGGGSLDATTADAGNVVDGGPAADGGESDGGRDAGADGGGDAGTLDDTGCDDVHAGRLFCSGFESGLTGWDGQSSNGGTLEVVTDVTYRGRAALKATGPVDTTWATAFADVFTLEAIGDQWYRAYYYVESIPTGRPVQVHEMAPVTWNYTMQVSLDPRPGESAVLTSGWAGDRWIGATAVPPTDRWFCVETHVTFGGANETMELYWDDALVARATDVATAAPEGLSRITAGISFKTARDPQRVVYVDEVVADNVRIGCD